eukprot:305769-Pyramimonas_sp.AAC.1
MAAAGLSPGRQSTELPRLEPPRGGITSHNHPPAPYSISNWERFSFLLMPLSYLQPPYSALRAALARSAGYLG